ncbi:hypothetical protein R1sor_010219 [Riccia sorocarpa]|uniref:Uncharacterized protein n=1 Tax=Riccia sorocarpa TaxID=122646 RepID=A0ABD3HXM8_9MARC
MLVELLLVGPIAQQRTPRLCSICKQPGHDRRTCGRQQSGNRHPRQHSTLTGVESQGVEVNHTTDDDSGEENISMTDDDLDFEGIHDEEVDDVPIEFLYGPYPGRFYMKRPRLGPRIGGGRGPREGPRLPDAALHGAASGKRGPSRGRLETWRPRLGPRIGGGRGRGYTALHGAASGKRGLSRGRLETWRPHIGPRGKSRPRIGPRFCSGRGRVHAALYGAALDTRGPSWGRLETLRPWTGPSQKNATPYKAACRQSWYLLKRMKLIHNSDPLGIALMSEIRQLYFGWVKYLHGFLCSIDEIESQTAIRGGS